VPVKQAYYSIADDSDGNVWFLIAGGTSYIGEYVRRFSPLR